ncbi:MAG: hypothetical protein HY235_06565 [Acidobacteria bacterium]|nr:hypothetical protein [Acidobacteriota bacterium]
MVRAFVHNAGGPGQKTPLGCYFYGTEGTFRLGWRDGWTFYPADFLEAVRNKRRAVCDIEIGYRSTAMSLLGMLSMKLGRSIRWDGEKEIVPGDAQANTLLARPYRKPWDYPKA